ncbi:MAG: caspase family protein [Spirosomataceae bacterium]
MKSKIVFCLVLFTHFSIAQTQTGFKRTWVFMVGVLEWADKETFAPFDKAGRVDAKIFKFFEKNGVPAEQMMYLQDKQATSKSVKEALQKFVKKATKDDVLFFYYCGHGYKNDASKVCFANFSGEDWTANEIVKTVNDNFAGNTAFFVADCCNSGGLANEARKYPTKNFVALNSVVPTDASTGNWTFSNALLYALQGQNFVDLNNDRKITLSEFVNYYDNEMAIVEGQKAAYYLPKSMNDWVMTSNISPKKNNRIGEKVLADYDGVDYLGFITDFKENKYNVRFYSYINDETEWLEAKRLKKFTCKKDFAAGSSVLVMDVDKKWYPAKVIKKLSCLHYVHYDDYGNEYDAWIHPDNIKLKK